MKVIEAEPGDLVIRRYVEKYQYFEVDGPLFVKSVPTGTLECWIVLDGFFEIFNPETATFFTSSVSGVFPMGSQACAYFVPKSVKCFNIKLKPQILSLPGFKSMVVDWKKFSAESFLGKDGLKKILSFNFLNLQKSLSKIDELLLAFNDFESRDPQIESILDSIFSESTKIKVEELASENYMTVKSLERLTKKVFGMPPKRLISILRFGESAKYLKQADGFRFIDALQFGYYDQSHFIRECKKITEMNPTEFLSKLKLSTHDLVVED